MIAENQVYKQIVARLNQIDDDIARLRHLHLMLRVDIQILWNKQNEKPIFSSLSQIKDDGVHDRL